MAKDDNKPFRPGNGPNNRRFQIRDETLERQFSLKMVQARKLFNDKKPADALTILDPMKDKFIGRGEFIDLLGACYASAGFIYEAREIFTRALTTPPKHKYRDALNKYNLVRLCALTGSPFIAYEYSQQLDCDIVAEAANRPSESHRCRELVAVVREAMEKSAREANMSFDDFVTFSLLLDKGRLEMNGPDVDLDEGIVTFEQASQLNPNSTTPYNNIGIIYLWQGKLEAALEKMLYILEHFDPNNLHALSNTVRLLCSLNRQEEARPYLDRLLTLEVEPHEDLVKIAEALIYFNEDQAIYDHLKLLNHNERMYSIFQIVDKAAAEQSLIFEVVAAANAGNRAKALELAWNWLGGFETHVVLFDRTYEALKNNESGPLPGGRFFYWEPKELYPQAAQSYRQVGPLLLSLPQSDEETTRYETILQPFFADVGQPALDYVAYLYWTNYEPEKLSAILTQTLKSGAAGTVELVKSLAFGQIGNARQRFAALTALVEAGLVGRDENVTYWLEQQPQTVTLTQLQQRFAETS